MDEKEYLTDVDIEDLYWLADNPLIYQRDVLLDLIQKIIRIAQRERNERCGQQSS